MSRHIEEDIYSEAMPTSPKKLVLENSQEKWGQGPINICIPFMNKNIGHGKRKNTPNFLQKPIIKDLSLEEMARQEQAKKKLQKEREIELHLQLERQRKYKQQRIRQRKQQRERRRQIEIEQQIIIEENQRKKHSSMDSQNRQTFAKNKTQTLTSLRKYQSQRPQNSFNYSNSNTKTPSRVKNSLEFQQLKRRETKKNFNKEEQRRIFALTRAYEPMKKQKPQNEKNIRLLKHRDSIKTQGQNSNSSKKLRIPPIRLKGHQQQKLNIQTNPIQVQNKFMISRLIAIAPSIHISRKILKTSFDQHQKLIGMRGKGNVKEYYKIYGRSKTMISRSLLDPVLLAKASKL